jgi:hypothetical protein
MQISTKDFSEFNINNENTNNLIISEKNILQFTKIQ